MSDDDLKLIQAKWIAPMDRPILRDGGVLIRGNRFVAVDASNALRASHPRAEVTDLPKSVILPGLINAHVHLELSDCSNGEVASATGSADDPSHKSRIFETWLIGMLQRTRIPDDQMQEKVTRAVAVGVDQCHRFGVTTVGDISRQAHITRPLLSNANLRVISFGEIMAMAQRRVLLDERLTLAMDRSNESETLRVGLTPHSPYSVEITTYRRCVDLARQHNLPLATHLAETPNEADFLANHTGPLRDLWDAWLTWDDHVPTFPGGPIRMAKAVGLLDYPSLLAHVNYCNDAELDLLAHGSASVVYCPRTHAFFDHPPHRFREMLARGVNVAVGTDSCASSPDLNLLDDLRLVRRLAPEMGAQAIWQLATTRAAKALQLQDQVGMLAPAFRADVIAFDVDSDRPLEEILREQRLPQMICFNGEMRR